MRIRRWVVAAIVVGIAAPVPRAFSAPADSTGASGPNAAAGLASPPVSTPPDYPRGRISGLVYADYFYNAEGNPQHVYSGSGADQGNPYIDGTKINPITKDLNSIFLRRVYFQLDNDLSVKYTTRLRLEVDSKSLTADGKITPFVKDAYFQAKSVIPRGDFYFGMINTPIYEYAEEFWQYRSIEKTIADFRGVASASDLGVEMKGFADPDHHIGYSAMIGNGSGQKPETDRFKRFYLSLPMRAGDLRLEPYADFQPVRVNLSPKVPSHTDSLDANNDQSTFKIFAGYEIKHSAVGVEALTHEIKQFNATNVQQRGLSVWARTMLNPAFGLVARFDRWQPNANAANRVDTQLWIAGVDWVPMPDLRVQPNVEIMRYDKVGSPPAAGVPAHNDVQARITFYYRFSRPQS